MVVRDLRLAASTIRDEAQRGLPQRRNDAEPQLCELLLRQRARLTLYAWGCKDAPADELVDVSSLLPCQVGRPLGITSALDSRSP